MLSFRTTGVPLTGAFRAGAFCLGMLVADATVWRHWRTSARCVEIGGRDVGNKRWSRLSDTHAASTSGRFRFEEHTRNFGAECLELLLEIADARRGAIVAHLRVRRRCRRSRRQRALIDATTRWPVRRHARTTHVESPAPGLRWRAAQWSPIPSRRFCRGSSSPTIAQTIAARSCCKVIARCACALDPTAAHTSRRCRTPTSRPVLWRSRVAWPLVSRRRNHVSWSRKILGRARAITSGSSQARSHGRNGLTFACVRSGAATSAASSCFTMYGARTTRMRYRPSTGLTVPRTLTPR